MTTLDAPKNGTGHSPVTNTPIEQAIRRRRLLHAGSTAIDTADRMELALTMQSSYCISFLRNTPAGVCIRMFSLHPNRIELW